MTSALVGQLRRCLCGELIVARPSSAESSRWCSTCIEFVDALLDGQREAPDPCTLAWLPKRGLDLPRVLARLERLFLDQALERAGGNKQRAARLLGLNRTTLVEKLKRQRTKAFCPGGVVFAGSHWEAT